MRELSDKAKGIAGFGDPQIRAAIEALTLVDGTIFRAVKRMAWAPAAGHGSAIKLHLHFAAFDQIPTDWLITPGNVCERKALKKMKQPGGFLVGDRYYSEDHLYLKQLQKEASDFVIRLLGNVIRRPRGPERPLTDEDRQAGVVSDRLEELGGQGGGPVLRVVEIHSQGKVFLLATTRMDLSAHQIGLIYRYRWQIELFFKWFKTTVALPPLAGGITRRRRHPNPLFVDCNLAPVPLDRASPQQTPDGGTAFLLDGLHRRS